MSHEHKGKRPHGWMGIHRGHKARPVEWLAEKGIFLVSLSAILVVFLIFFFVAREALPVFLGQMNSALVKDVIPVGQMDSLSRDKLRAYLDLPKKQFAAMDHETLKVLMEVKTEEQASLQEEF